MQMITSREYLGIRDRGRQPEKVSGALGRIINALPTQIHPEDRTKLLDALLTDLKDDDGASWLLWPNDVSLLALTAIKCLGRNPIGSEILLEAIHLRTILYHTGLPITSLRSPSSSPSRSRRFVNPSPTSPTALEALRVVANLLVLHSRSRTLLADLGAGRVLAQAFAGLDTHGEVIQDDAVDSNERLFLLGRIGFLVTLERNKVVEEMVVEDDLIKSLTYYLYTLDPVPANFMALTELLKLVNNVIRYHPHDTMTPDSDPWTLSFDTLLRPCLRLLYSLPFSTLTAPLSTTIHVLLTIPFLPRLISTWQSVIPAYSSEAESPGRKSPSSSPVKNLLNRMSIVSPQRRGSSSSATGTGAGAASNGSTPQPSTLSLEAIFPKTRRPKTPDSMISSSSGRSDRSSSSPGEKDKSMSSFLRSPLKRPTTPPPPSKRQEIVRVRVPDRPLPSSSDPTGGQDPTLFPKRIMGILQNFIDTYLPGSKGPDDKLEPGLRLDEDLPPVLLLLAKAAEGDEEMRRCMKEVLLPADLDRSLSAGPLEKRSTLLGAILRCMNCASHQQTRDSAGEFMWAVCDADASTICAEIGYGNAAGLLFRKGVSGPPPGKITTLPDSTLPVQPSSTTAGPSTSSSTGASSTPRHPITGLSDSSPGRSPHSAQDANQTGPIGVVRKFDDLTEAEQEAEASKLFNLFDRLDRNPILSTQAPDGTKKGLGEAMREKYVEVDKGWGEREREEREKEDEEDEEAVRKEMEAYKKRMQKR